MSNPLGELLRAWRKHQRYSLRELAQESGISAGYIQQLEAGTDKRSGKSIRPSPEILRKLAQALGESYESLMAAAGYLPATGALARLDGHQTSLPPEVIKELQEVIAQATIEVLRRRGLIQ